MAMTGAMVLANAASNANASINITDISGLSGAMPPQHMINWQTPEDTVADVSSPTSYNQTNTQTYK